MLSWRWVFKFYIKTLATNLLFVTVIQLLFLVTTGSIETQTHPGEGSSSNQQPNHSTETWPQHINREWCASSGDCSVLPVQCMHCRLDYDCIYGKVLNVTCKVPEDIQCTGPHTFTRNMTCRHCYQTPEWQQTCVKEWKHMKEHCMRSIQYGGLPPKLRANCTVLPHVLCLGRRSFHKLVKCNWTSGYSWTTTLILSITLGGFGADRFYLGRWQEGIGKLFSFGGLGVWTLIDVVLVAIRYLGPVDGSLYIY